MTTDALTDTLQETLLVFEESGVPWTTPEVATRLEQGRRSTYNRLERLADHGLLETKKVGANGRVWWRPSETTHPALLAWSAAAGSLVDDVLDDVEVGIFVLDEDFDVAWINEATERYFGLDRDQVLGQDKRELIEAHIASIVEESDAFAETVLATYEDNTYTEHFECHVTAGEHRTERWLEHRSKPIETGEYAGGRVELYYDVTARKRSEQQLAHEQALVEQVFETAPVGIYVFGPNRRLVRANERLTDVLGPAMDDETPYTAGDATLLGDDGEPLPMEDRPVIRVFESGEPVANQEVRIPDSDGSSRWLSVDATPLTDEDGEVARVIVTTTDVTQLKEQSQRLERRRDELEAELNDIFTRIDDAFYALDEQLRFEYLNDSAEGLLGRTEAEVLGKSVWSVLSVADDDPMRDHFRTAMDTQEPTTFERYSDPLGIWEDVRVYPSESGLSVYFTDITERKERERELEEYRRWTQTLIENFPSGAVSLVDEDLQYVTFGGTLEGDTNVTRANLEGRPVREALPAQIEEIVAPRYEAALDGVPSEFEATIDGRVYQFHFEPVRDDDGNVFAATATSRDITNRKERERELTRYETLFEESKGVNVIVESDGTFRYVTPSAETVFGYEPEELVGEVGFEYVHPDDRDEVVAEFAKMIDTPGYEPRMDFRFQHRDGSWLVVEVLARDLRTNPDIEGVVVYTRDITERKEREQELERYAGIIDAVGEPVYELDTRGRFTFVNEAFIEQSGYEEDELLGQHISIGMDDEAIVRAEAQILDLLADDPDGNTSLEYEVVTKDGERFPVENRISLLTDEDGKIYGSAGVLWDITERVERQRELERQREQLAALNNLNDVVQDITDAVIEQSTREEIEMAVCERLAASDSYEFAWIAEVDPKTMTLVPHAEAGVDGYLDDVPISMDPNEPSGRGPGGRAVQTRRIQTTQDALQDPDFEPWREHAKEYGFRSAAAIPIVYGDTLYGLLAVYADRPNAFEGQEQEVIGQLGEVVGHAIAAIERKQALTSDEVTELLFTVPDFADVTGIGMTIDGTIDFDRAVSAGDGAYLEYGTVDVDAIPALEALASEVPHFEDVTILDRGADTAQFELRLSDPPIVSVVASHGGYLQHATIEDGDFHLTVHLPVTVDARRIIDAVQEVYPTVDLLRRRQITRSEDTIAGLQQAVAADLTERQRSALEAAYHLGFFEWPREANGEEVAESLGIAPATFSQHLRKAERKVFESLYSAAATT